MTEDDRSRFIEVATFDDAIAWLCENAPEGGPITAECVSEIFDHWEQPGTDLRKYPIFRVAETSRIYQLTGDLHEHSPECWGGGPGWLLVTPTMSEAYCAICKRRFQYAEAGDGDGGWLPLEWSPAQVNGHFRAKAQREEAWAAREAERESFEGGDEDEWQDEWEDEMAGDPWEAERKHRYPPHLELNQELAETVCAGCEHRGPNPKAYGNPWVCFRRREGIRGRGTVPEQCERYRTAHLQREKARPRDLSERGRAGEMRG